MKTLLLLSLLSTFVLAATKVATLNIEGMTCPLCTSAIKKSLKHTDGVIKAKVYLNKKEAIVTYEDTQTKTEELLNAVKNAGYTAKIKEIK